MRNKWSLSLIAACLLFLISGALILFLTEKPTHPAVLGQNAQSKNEYWLLLDRASKQEFLFQGIPGNQNQSQLIKQFQVNVGIKNERPTPLPQLMNRPYWNIIAKYEVKDDPETAPYFLTLDVPWSDSYPFGPTPYNECNGAQCDWVRPGSFGLHGIAESPEKLTDAGSSGCIRHKNEDITYLYNLLNPSEQNPIHYYINDR